MSRIKNFSSSVTSGYLAMVANILYTMGSVPLGLTFLSKQEFGLWAVLLQIVGYLALIDFGMSGAVYRFLIDHKDSAAREYGTVLATGGLVFAVQGGVIFLAGWLLSSRLGSLMGIDSEHVQLFERLMLFLCGLTGASFATRILWIPLQSHQRFDILNWIQIGQLLIGFAINWIGLRRGWGLNSMIVSMGATIVFQNLAGSFASWRLSLLPSWADFTKPSFLVFRDMSSFGGNLFLLSVGWQLISASQLIIVTRLFGLESAAVWSVASKPFLLAQQVAWRLSDFSGASLAEMQVREEFGRLRMRYADLLALTVWMSVIMGVGIAATNKPFLDVWTHGRISWPIMNDLLMGVYVLLGTVGHCNTASLGILKRLDGLGMVYLIEGLLFCSLGWVLARSWGLTGLIVASLCASTVCSVSFSTYQIAKFFNEQFGSVLCDWILKPAASLIGLIIPTVFVTSFSKSFPPLAQLTIDLSIIAPTAAFFLVRWSQPSRLRVEILDRFRIKIWAKQAI